MVTQPHRAKQLPQKIYHIALTPFAWYGTKYSNGTTTCDVDSVFKGRRGLWWTARGYLRTGASPVTQLKRSPQGLEVRESLFLFHGRCLTPAFLVSDTGR